MENAGLCRYYFTSSGCRYGESCKYQHVKGEPGAMLVGRASNTVRHRQDVSLADLELAAWKRLIPRRNRRSQLLESRLGLFFREAHKLVIQDHAALQEVVKELAGDGLQLIRELCDRAIDLPIPSQTILVEEAVPFFKILSDSAVTRSPSLEEHVQRIYSYIGHNAVRFADLFDLFLNFLENTGLSNNGSGSILQISHEDVITIPIMVLSNLLDYSADAALNPTVKNIAQRLGEIFLADGHLDDATKAEIGRFLIRIDRRLRLGLNLDELSRSIRKPHVHHKFILRQEAPGNRHDNDHDDICKISILPTISETRSARPEYLPTTDPDTWHTSPDQALTGLLDRHFRLLREDSVGPLRDAVRMILESQNGNQATPHGNTKSTARTFRYQNVEVVSLETDANSRGFTFVVTLDEPTGVLKSSLTKKNRQDWWRSSRRLSCDALVCLLELKAGGDIAFCIVQRRALDANRHGVVRDENELAIHWNEEEQCLLRLSLASTNEHDLRFVLKNFPRTGNHSQRYMLVEFPGVLLPGFEPVLKTLQVKKTFGDLPFLSLLTIPTTPLKLADEEMELPTYARRVGFRFNLSPICNGEEMYLDPRSHFDPKVLEGRSTLDAAQARAVVKALTSQFALIQGPPGTGKSYSGVQLIRVLLATSTKKNQLSPILVVCYTNHALDQLLEHLLAANIKQIVRIGGRSKSEALKNLNLNKITSEQGTRTKGEKHEYWKVYEELKTLQGELERLNVQITRSASWETLKPSVEAMYHGLARVIDDEADADGFKVVHSNTKRQNPQARFKHWLQGDREENAATRRQHFETWVNDAKEPLIAQYQNLLARLEETQKRKHRLKMEEELRCLHQANIIGVTSSGLARRQDLLRNLQCKIVVLEEAGELLESHTLVSLLPSVEHAILIGDHLQLRPQIANYELSRESAGGLQYSLDVSLFERLVTPSESIRSVKIPFTTLELQRRMHPSISALIRAELYPSLSDSPTVFEYPNVQGMRRRLYWLDHKEYEAGENEEQSTSHWNAYEVEMTLALTSHLLKQGVYNGRDNIAVLTPYLGQLQRLRQRMQAQYEIVVSDRDEDDLRQQGLTEAGPETIPSPQLQKSRMLQAVRLATIDNFQGEEASVVIISLVRSNAHGKVGFLRTSNRINVLLSRAKHGMYIIGNSDTARSVPFWAKILDTLQTNENLGPDLELVCPRHQNTAILVRKPDDFAKFSPEGGCQLRCDQRLDCGHVCKRSCHSSVLHAAVQCLEPCRKILTCKHPCPKQCYEACEKYCKVNIPMGPDHRLPCGHSISMLQCQYVNGTSEYRCHEMVQKSRAVCQHVMQIACCQDVDSKEFECPQLCGATLPCGHNCTRYCHVCRPLDGPVDHGSCLAQCGRAFSTCSHSCKSQCHSETACKPCEARCESRCEHSRCLKLCSEPCVPCAEEFCQVGCKHARCSEPCAVPCSHLPCSKRCDQLLACGHRCPALCSERCPDSKYCQICSSDEVKSMAVDFVLGETYAEINLDEDPIVVPACGHLITMTNLDGHMDMRMHYDLAGDGTVIALTTSPPKFSSKELKFCPTCRGTLSGIRRYARITRRAFLDESTKKFATWANQKFAALGGSFVEETTNLSAQPEETLLSSTERIFIMPYLADLPPIEGGLASQLKRLQNLGARRHTTLFRIIRRVLRYRQLVQKTEQPFLRVYELVENLKANGRDLQEFTFDSANVAVGFAIKTSTLVVRALLFILSDVLEIRRLNSCTGPVFVEWRAIFRECLDLIAISAEAHLPRDMTESHIFAIVVCTGLLAAGDEESSNADLKAMTEEHIKEARKLLEENRGSTRGLQAELDAAELRFRGGTFYRPVTSEEMKEVYEAMSAEFSGTGHWYVCENGHPFTVGECGMPMEQARCNECGAGVGGQHHRAVEGVQRASEIEEQFGQMRL